MIMWKLAFLFLFVLHAEGKSSNLCRRNAPNCDGNKVIQVSAVMCVNPSDDVMWTISKGVIEKACDKVNYCDIDELESAVDSCCGENDFKLAKKRKSKLRFAYECVQGEIATTKPTPPKMMTTLPSSAGSSVAFRQTTHPIETENFCQTNICYEKPYCSAGTEIAVMKVSDSSEPGEIMNSLTYYCNKNQRCSEDYQPYIDSKCRLEDTTKLHYICMKEKVTTTVMCHDEEMIDNEEGQIRSSDYPNMIPAGTSECRIKIHFDELSILELFMLDLPVMDVMYQDENFEWSSTIHVSTRHRFIPRAYTVLLSIDIEQLPQRRIWMYYRAFTASSYGSPDVSSDLPWTNNCMTHASTPKPMGFTSPRSNPSIYTSKDSMIKQTNSTNPSKDMRSMPHSEVDQEIHEMSTAPHIVIPDGLPVGTEMVDKMQPVTFPVMPSTTGTNSNIPSGSSSSDTNPVDKPPYQPAHRGNREKVSSVSETPTTGLYSREVVIGLIAGVVILACLVVILLTALVASMRRRQRRSSADGGEERDERHNNGPGGTTNENLVSFQYLKTLPTDGDNSSATLGTKSQQSDNSQGGDSTSKKSPTCKPNKKKSSLAPSESGSNKTGDTVSSREDSVFHCLKNIDDFSDFQTERSKSIDSGQMIKNDSSFSAARGRIDGDALKPVDNHEGRPDDEVFRDVAHFYVNGDDYALVQKDSHQSTRNTIISEKSLNGIYANFSSRPKSGSSGSCQDSDVLEWTNGFNLAV